MTESTPTPRCADVLARTLELHGVDRLFTVPGESFLGLLDALRDRPGIDVVTCRHEGGAALAAAADGRVSGQPGVVAVSRGPGVSNAMIGIHVAQQDAIPLVVLVGQVDRPNLGRGAFQEVDYHRLFGGIAKWVGQVDDPNRAGEVLARAFAEATRGTAGPAIVVLPEDVLQEPCSRPPVAPSPSPVVGLPSAALQAFCARLQAAQRPVVIVGSQDRGERFRGLLQTLCERWSLPVAVTNKQQDLFDNTHPLYVGHLGYFPHPPTQALLRQADLVVALGTRLGDVATQGYSFPALAPDTAGLVHVYPDPQVPGRLFTCEQAFAVPAAVFAQEVLQRAPATPPQRAAWLQAVTELAKARGRLPVQPDREDGVDFTCVAQAIQERLAPDAVVTVDAGNFSTWAHRVLQLKPTHDMVAAACGAMGIGVPAALAAALRWPQRQVIAFCGDGGILMTGNELATACARGANLKVFVADNGSYGTIRTHQEMHFPGRPVATRLANPDFAAWAEAFGARGFHVRASAQAQAVVQEALAHPGPAVVHVHCSLEYLMAGVRLSEVKKR